eukprot:TRINITY_DN49_c0_g1_i1.p1 TRINITY_DN49_c0_g1~~TRINITY_DN49_c0_g1_i1.p1  ORF type:complete len:432 (-),score=116.55 TRINITY_DN49_c0_g1_i1:67-1362(-)
MNRERVLPKIQISNLPEDITAKELRELCSRFGQVRDTTFDSVRCEGHVNFAKSEDAAAAIYKLDRSTYYGGTIKVSWARPPPEQQQQPQQKGKQGEAKDARPKGKKNPTPGTQKDSGKSVGVNPVGPGTNKPKEVVGASPIVQTQPRVVVGAPVPVAKKSKDNSKQNPNPNSNPNPNKKKETTTQTTAPKQTSKQTPKQTAKQTPKQAPKQAPKQKIKNNESQQRSTVPSTTEESTSTPTPPSKSPIQPPSTNNVNQATPKKNTKTSAKNTNTSAGSSKLIAKPGADHSTSSQHVDQNSSNFSDDTVQTTSTLESRGEEIKDNTLVQQPQTSQNDPGYSFFTTPPPFPELAPNTGSSFDYGETEQRHPTEPTRHDVHFELVLRNVLSKEDHLVAVIGSTGINITHPSLIKHFIWPVLGEYVLNYINASPSQ